MSRAARVWLLGFFLLCASGRTQAQAVHRRVVIILVPGLRADDLSRPELPNLRLLVARAAVGWMNSRTARIPGQTRESELAAYLSLGAGSRATAGDYAKRIDSGTLARLKADNNRLDHPVTVGLLGDAAHSARLYTQVFGGIEASGPSGEGLLVAMDSRGAVDQDQTDPRYWAIRAASRGTAANIDVPDPIALLPYGAAFDTGKSRFYNDGSDLSVLVFGDLDRADNYSPVCLPGIARQHRSEALSTLNGFLEELEAESAPGSSWSANARYVLLAAAPAHSAAEGDRLAPILMWGDGVEPGLLTSGSTHTLGLVTNTDFLPTVATYLGIPVPKGLIGRPMTVRPLVPDSGLLAALKSLLHMPVHPLGARPEASTWATLHDRWYSQSRKQSLFGGLPTVQFLLVVGSLLPFVPSSLRRSSFPALLCALPLFLLVLPPISPESVAWSGAMLGVALAIVGVWAWIRPGSARPLAFACLAGVVALVALDLLSGGWLLRQAWMSYSVMEGARYYGIGNEYAGAVFGAMIAMSAFALRDDARRWPWVTAAWLAVSSLVGLPQGGANAGGLLGAAVGCGVAAIVWRRGRIGGRELAMVIAAAAVIMAGALAWDLARGAGEQSHIARSVASGGSLLNIATRKAMLNGYLLFHSPWTLGLLAAGYGLWRRWREVHAEDGPGLGARGAMAGLVVGSVALLVLNDSGVVAAADCLLAAYGGFSLVLPIMDSQTSTERGGEA